MADCLLSQNYQHRPRQRPARPQAAGGAPAGPPRQHYAVKHKQAMGMSIPQQWQPAPDAAAGSAEPFAPAAYQQRQPQQQAQQQEEQGAVMDVDREEI